MVPIMSQYVCRECGAQKPETAFRFEPRRCDTCVQKRPGPPVFAGASGPTRPASATGRATYRMCVHCRAVKRVGTDFRRDFVLCNSCAAAGQPGQLLMVPGMVPQPRSPRRVGAADPRGPLDEDGGGDAGTHQPKLPLRRKGSHPRPSSPKLRLDPAALERKANSPPERRGSTSSNEAASPPIGLHPKVPTDRRGSNSSNEAGSPPIGGNPKVSPKKVNVGEAGLTMKQVLEFDDTEPVVTVALRVAQEPDLLTSPHLPDPEHAGVWSPNNCVEIPEDVAQHLDRFDISHAANYSCQAAANVLNRIGEAWPHDFAVCLSASRRTYWLLARGKTRPSSLQALKAHDSLNRIGGRFA